ncbi:MAG: ATP-binding response regulator, partial [Gammaproteobacteria bacterium]
LVKPFSARELLARVSAHVEMARVRREAADQERLLREEAELARSQTNAILESMTDGFIAMDRDWRYTYMNAAAERINNRPRSAFLGKTNWELFPDVLGTDIERQMRRGHDERTFIEFEAFYEPWGRWFANRIHPTPDGGIAVFFQDITERKPVEEALKEADRRKNEFLAMLAHELRNPLAPMRNALEIVRLTEGNRDAGQSAAEMMKRQIGQMVRLVDDLLDVSRISRGKIELRKGRVELASAVNHAVEAAQPLCERMNHELTVTLPPQPMYLNGDPTRLAQVVGNLLTNACKFTDKGGRISLTVERERGEALLRVRDTGIGIAADQLPRIFKMFTQLDTSLERTQSGLGIGLTLVRELVEMHGGTVEAQSAGIGQGSEFVVRLPILVETPEPPPEPTVSEPTPTTARRILVVDDNRDSAESLAMLLELTGNQTHTAYDGLEAVEAAATFKPDVVLLDIGLPKMNGFEAARKIREQPWGTKMLLVALTGWGQDEDRQKSREAGFDGHLVKPVDHGALTKLLAELGAG